MSFTVRASMLLLISCLISASVDTQAHAEDSDYERAVREGLTAFKAHEYDRARRHFEHAHTLAPNARTFRALGLIAVEQKRYSQAHRELEAARRDERQPLTAEQQREVSDMLAWMQTSLARVVLKLDPAVNELRVRVDDESEPTAPPLLLEAGERVLHASAPGYRPIVRKVTLLMGQQLELGLSLVPLAIAQSHVDDLSTHDDRVRHTSARPLVEQWWFWTAIGVVLAAGVVATAVALSPSSEPAGLEVAALSKAP